MASFTTGAAAIALGVEPKWLDNLLSRNHLTCLPRARQGVQRRLPMRALETIAVARDLAAAAPLPYPTAIALAQALLDSPNATLQLGATASLSLDRVALQSYLARSVAHAVEIAPHPPRGRPRLPSPTRADSAQL